MAMNPKHDTSTDADLRTRAEQYLTYQSSTEDLIRFLLAEVDEARRSGFEAGYARALEDDGFQGVDAAYAKYQHSRQG